MPVGTVPVAPVPDTTSDTLLFKTLRCALLKAFGLIHDAGRTNSCMFANMVALKVLEQFGVGAKMIGGYQTLPGLGVDVPHTWVECVLPGEREPCITDLAFIDPPEGSDPETTPTRMIMILGAGVGFTTKCSKSVYKVTRTLPLPPDHNPASVRLLHACAADPVGYLHGVQQRNRMDQDLQEAQARGDTKLVEAITNAREKSQEQVDRLRVYIETISRQVATDKSTSVTLKVRVDDGENA